MSEETELEPEVVASEQPDGEQPEAEGGPQMVPLAALQAERKKRQESEAKAQLYQEYLMRAKEQAGEKPEEEDPSALVERKHLQESNQLTKREIMETIYQDMNPEAVQKINKYLQPILEKKPWLAASVDTATNRYARAYEIVTDYLHLVEDKPAVKPKTTDGQRIVANSQKPGSPVDVGKSATPGGADYLKSIQGKKEFREYRQKLLSGEAG